MAYYCKKCKKYFSVKLLYQNERAILKDHLEGLSFRELSRKYKISASTCWRICLKRLKKLPDSNQITAKYCNRFSGVFLCGGKYFKIKGLMKRYCLLWIVDYLKHDIVAHTIAPLENYQSWARVFSIVRIQNNYPKILVCDGLPSIEETAKLAFPNVKIQTCVKHYIDNIKYSLKEYKKDKPEKESQIKKFFLSLKEILYYRKNRDRV